MHTKVRLNDFLKQVERKAFRIASIAVGNPDDAMDIVQETMLSLVKSYGNKPEDDWPKLFFRILYNRINDHFRRQSVRQKVMKVRSWFASDGEVEDTIEQAPAHSSAEPCRQLHSDNISASVEDSLKQLSPKQSEAFLMRSWQGLSVKDTAQGHGLLGRKRKNTSCESSAATARIVSAI